MSTIIEDLKNPASLPDSTETVSVVQTHISMVFVGDEFVYKVKKPVNFGFLDFTTLEKRHYYCQQEVKLNRRLAKNLYVGVLPVRRTENGYSLRETSGEIADYAVKMKRIPQELLMKSLFQQGQLTEEHLKSVSESLVKFHRSALRNAEIDRFGAPSMVKVNTDENFSQVSNYIGVTIAEKEFNALKRWTEEFYAHNEALFLDRITQGKIRDCHGDLHMEHICLSEDPAIFDCIEFNDRFRYSDALSDVAFLLMDLEYHGGERFAEALWEHYCVLAGEKDVKSLLTFYKIYRAFVRGKVNSFQLDDESIDREKKDIAIQTAKKYFELAFAYIA